MKKAFLWWKQTAAKIGNFQLTVVFSVLYFILFVPLGFVVSLKHDYLGKKGRYQWNKAEYKKQTLTGSKEQS